MRSGQVVGLLVLLLFLPLVSADIIVFTAYDTSTTLSDGFLHIERSIVLKNVGGAPVIPGELHFKLHELVKDKEIGPEIRNLRASDQYNTDLRSNIVRTDSQTDLIVSVWNPLLPDFSYPLTLSYDFVFEPRGLLFYEISVPQEETTIPIMVSSNKFLLPEKYKVTFAPNASIDNVNGFSVVSWGGRDAMAIEYSKIPLPKLPVKGVNVFWITLIVLLLIPFMLKIIRLVRSP
jgi:hypothetical protein